MVGRIVDSDAVGIGDTSMEGTMEPTIVGLSVAAITDSVDGCVVESSELGVVGFIVGDSDGPDETFIEGNTEAAMDGADAVMVGWLDLVELG